MCRKWSATLSLHYLALPSMARLLIFIRFSSRKASDFVKSSLVFGSAVSVSVTKTSLNTLDPAPQTWTQNSGSDHHERKWRCTPGLRNHFCLLAESKVFKSVWTVRGMLSSDVGFLSRSQCRSRSHYRVLNSAMNQCA